MKVSNERGFTLIELLVVVLIIGILAAVAVPQYQKAVWKSRFATIKQLTRSIANAEEIYYLANSRYTKDWNALDIGLEGATSCTNEENTHSYCYFPWGNCRINTGLEWVECGLNRNGTKILAYKVNFNHNPDHQDIQCMAYNFASDNDMQNQICTSETGHAADYGTSTWSFWVY